MESVSTSCIHSSLDGVTNVLRYKYDTRILYNRSDISRPTNSLLKKQMAELLKDLVVQTPEVVELGLLCAF